MSLNNNEKKSISVLHETAASPISWLTLPQPLISCYYFLESQQNNFDDHWVKENLLINSLDLSNQKNEFYVFSMTKRYIQRHMAANYHKLDFDFN